MPSRPRLLILVLLLFCIAHVWRAGLGIQQSMQLSQLSITPSPIYEVVTSAAWALTFGICAVGGWLRSRWISWAAILAGVLNQAHVWVDRLAFSRSTESFQTLGFAALLSFVLLLLIFIPAIAFRFSKPK